MAKKKVIEELQSADKQHSQRTERYIRQVDILYRKAVEEITKLAGRVKGLKEGETFSFDKTTSVDKDVEQCLKNLCSQIKAVVEKGEKGEWYGACDKNDKFIASVLSASKLKKSTLQRYQNRNLEALSAFQERKVDGLGLSDRIWKYVKNTKNEIELAIDTSKIEISLGSGTSAAALSRDVRSCLVHPDKLFRRVRDKYGNLQLSKAASLYHPGQGVYRSSYKNAMRLARTEINIAYRQSDYLRWQQLDFVVGIQVETSNNHTAEDADGKGRHQIVDICDALAGKYPKDFKFVGWHPQCKCHATPILKSLDEIEQEVDEDGNYKQMPSADEVNDVPDNFKKYIADNAERIDGWSSVPYYIKDNPQYVDEIIVEAEKKINGRKIKNFGAGDEKPVNTTGQFVEISKEEIVSRLEKLNENYTHEVAYVILQDGRTYCKSGAKDVVNFSKLECSFFRDGVLYHNHPKDTLSPHDVIFAVRHKLSEIKVIAPDAEYSAKLTDETFSFSDKSFDELYSIYDKIGDRICESMKGMNSKDYSKALSRFDETNLQDFCKLMGIVYAKKIKQN